MAEAKARSGNPEKRNLGTLSLALSTDEAISANDGLQPTESSKAQEARNSPIESAAREVRGKKLYQDELYGTKELSPLAVALIDTPEFQRLGQIYQLGFTHMVFRGATHRRFDHSVGTYFVVRTMLRRIVQNHARFYKSAPDEFCHPGLWLSPRLYMEAPATPRDWQKLNSPMGRWRGLVEVISGAALLHDLGHVPVGHTMEDEFSLFRKHDSLGGPRLFEMLYGPREPLTTINPTKTNPHIEDYFSPIDTNRLPRPEPWERVPLPWVLEEGTYERFLPDVSGGEGATIPALRNCEIRDLIYLILSFKETVDGEPGHVKYKTFEQELDEAQRAEGNNHSEKELAPSRCIAFIRALYKHYSAPIDVGRDQEQLPLFHPFMSDVIANTICADLLDYLVRDGRRLKLDIRDNPRLQRYLVIRPASSSVAVAHHSASGPPRRLAINAVQRNGLKRRDTVSDLMDLMSERYRFVEVVYYHHKKAAFSAMIAKAIEILSKSRSKVKQLDKGGIYPAPWAPNATLPSEPRHVCHFGDESLLAFLAKESEEAKSEPAAALVRGIISRSEHRLIFTLDYEAASAAGGPRKIIDHLRQPDDTGRIQMEETLRALVSRSGIEGEVPILLYCPNIRMQAKEVAAHVELTPNKIVPLSLEGEDSQVAAEISVLNGKYQRLWRLYIFAHPKLAFERNETKRLFLLSTIVDTFCAQFGVPEQARSRGSRFDFIPFQKRLHHYFREWLKTAPLNFKIDFKMERRVERIAEDLEFWRALLPKDGPFPVTDEDYRIGLNRALLICIADDATSGHRERWSDPLKKIKGHAWYVPSSVPSVEEARRSAFDLLGSLAATGKLEEAVLAKRNELGALASDVTTQLKLGRSNPAPECSEQPVSDRAAEILMIIQVFAGQPGSDEQGIFSRRFPIRLTSLTTEQYQEVVRRFRDSAEQQKVIDASALDHRGAKVRQAFEWLDFIIEQVKKTDGAHDEVFEDGDA